MQCETGKRRKPDMLVAMAGKYRRQRFRGNGNFRVNGNSVQIGNIDGRGTDVVLSEQRVMKPVRAAHQSPTGAFVQVINERRDGSPGVLSGINVCIRGQLREGDNVRSV